MVTPDARRRSALYVLFFLPGAAIASWVTRTPAIRDQLGASTEQMGLILFGLSAGCIIGVLSASPLTSRIGTRAVISLGSSSFIASLPVIGLGALFGSHGVVAFGLALFGAGMGSCEVTINIEGSQVERAFCKPFLPALHGCFSLGNVVGALLGIAATAAGVSVVWHLSGLAFIATAPFAGAIRFIPRGVGRAAEQNGSETLADMARPAVWRNRPLLVLCFIVLAMALAEGTATDWLTLIMVDGHGFNAALGSSIFAAFSATMAVARFMGGTLVRRFGTTKVLVAAASSAASGLALVAFADNRLLVVAAVTLWGFGAALGFPVTLSCASRLGDESSKHVALVSTFGYLAFLVGPPALGFFGEHVGLRNALTIPIAAAVGAAIVAVTARLARLERSTTITSAND